MEKAMGILNLFRKQKPITTVASVHQDKTSIAVGAKDTGEITLTFNNKNITFSGNLESYDYDKILRQKQQNIYRLFE